MIPFILITAPKVPKGERGKGIKKGRVTSTPHLLLTKKWPNSWASRIVIKNRAYQIPPTKKQETIVRRNKIKCKITPHLVISLCFM